MVHKFGYTLRLLGGFFMLKKEILLKIEIVEEISFLRGLPHSYLSYFGHIMSVSIFAEPTSCGFHSFQNKEGGWHGSHGIAVEIPCLCIGKCLASTFISINNGLLIP